MFQTSDYYRQSMSLPAENSFQIALLQWTDTAIFLREASKMGTLIGTVVSASSLVFNFDPTIALSCTAVFIVTFAVTRECAKSWEPQAKDMIQHFKQLQGQRRSY